MPRSSLPPVGFRFDLKFFDSKTKAPFIEGDGPDGSFQSVSGISIEFEVQNVKEGSSPAVPKAPMKPIFPDLVLSRGVLLESKILNWVFTLIKDAKMVVTPLDLELTLKNDQGDPLMQFKFFRTWPRKWSISDFNAMESNLVIETLELAYEYFEPKIINPS
ncbi:MAG: phage tail protein [Bacteroidota bacterium]